MTKEGNKNNECEVNLTALNELYEEPIHLSFLLWILQGQTADRHMIRANERGK